MNFNIYWNFELTHGITFKFICIKILDAQISFNQA